VQEAKSGAVGVAFKFGILAQYNEETSTFESWKDYEPNECYGTVWLIKKDSTINLEGVKQLVRSLGWNADLEKVTGHPPEVEVQITVNAQEYNNETTYRASWINPWNFTPGSSSRGASPEEAKKLQGRFGSLLRAASAGVEPPKPQTKVADKSPL
jgi:hypothetical protein